MKYLVYNDKLDAVALAHEARCRLWPGHMPTDGTTIKYKFVIREHPSTDQVAVQIQDADVGLIDEELHEELIDELPADWTPQEDTP